MQIIGTALLSEDQKQEIQALQSLCNAYEGLHSDTLLTNKFNLDKQMPCFFLGYDDDGDDLSRQANTGRRCLVSFLYLFFIDPSIIEITAFTAPSARCKGWYTKLYRAALPHMKTSSASRVLFQIEPVSDSGMKTLHEMFPEAVLSHSEYQLSCTSPLANDIIPLEMAEVTQQNKEIAIHLAIEIFQSDETVERSHIEAILAEDGNDAFIAYDGQLAIGVCNRVLEDDYAGLFGLGIRPASQHQGYGKRMLASMVRKALQERGKVTLEVDSSNPPALNLYLHNGFSINSQMDYYSAPIA